MARPLIYFALLSIFLIACSSTPFQDEVVKGEAKTSSSTASKAEKKLEPSEPSPYADSTSIEGIRVSAPTKKQEQTNTLEEIPPPTRAGDSLNKLAPPQCSIHFYPDTVPTGGGTVMVWKMENAVSGSYNCRNQLIKGEVTALYGQIKLEKTPKSLFCSFIATGANGRKEKCTTSLISKPVEDKLPACTAAFSPEEVAVGGKTILSWSTVNAQRVFYRCPELKINAEVREEFGSRVLDKIQKPVVCEIVAMGSNETQAKCQANLSITP